MTKTMLVNILFIIVLSVVAICSLVSAVSMIREENYGIFFLNLVVFAVYCLVIVIILI